MAQGSTLIASLQKKKQQLTYQWSRQWHLQWCHVIISASLCLLSMGTPAQINDNLPLLGDPVSAIVSPADEVILGRAYLRALRSQMPIISDPILNTYTRQLTTRIIAASNSEIPPIQIAMINSAAINAFAVPGGILGMNAGLFLYTTTEDELSAVLAHELAHLSQRHYARGIEHRQRTKWATYTGLLASLALLATSDSSTGIASILATQAATIDANLQFSRQNEREADRVGMESLYNAGFDPRAMPAFFGRLLHSKQFSGTEDYEFLNTHPVTKSRISDSQARADQLTNQTKPMDQSLLFQFMQARIGAAYTATPQDAVAQFRNKLKKKRDNEPYRYGLARAYLRNQQFNSALKTILNTGAYSSQKFIHNTTTTLEFGLVEIEIYIEQEQYQKAKDKIQSLQRLYPTQIPLRYYLAKTEIGLSENESAVAILEDLLRSDPENILFLDKLLLAHRNLNNHNASLTTQARISFAQGQYDKARQHYQQALASITQNNLPLKAKIEYKLQEINQLEQKIRQFSQ